MPSFNRQLDPISGLLSLVSFACFLIIGLHWFSVLQLAAWIAFSLLTALPGWSLGYILGGRQWLGRVEFWAAGAVAGWAISGYLLLIVGYLSGGVRLWPLWILTPLLLLGAIIFNRSDRPAPGYHLGEWKRNQWRVLTLTLAIVMVFITRPFITVGSLTPDGYAYPWLFGFDFTNRVSIAANGAVSLPPNYFHIYGETFYYYMLTYIHPIAFKLMMNSGVEMFSTLLMWCVNLAVCFTVLLVALLRLFVRRWKALLLAILTIFVGYSYYWTYLAVKTYARANPDQFPATVGDGFWMGYSNVSHLVYRYFLVEPQTVLALAILLPVLGYFLLTRGHLRQITAGCGIGFALGIVFGVDALTTLWVGMGIGVLAIADLIASRKNLLRPLIGWVVAGLVATVMALGYYQIGMYSAATSQSLVIAMHPTFAKIFPAFMLVEFGPLIIFGLIGGGLLWSKNRVGAGIWWLLLLMAAWAVCYLQSQYDDQLGLLKGSRFLFIIFALGVGVFAQWFFTRSRSLFVRIVVALVLLTAIPTWATDWSKTADTGDRSETVYVYPEDYAACNWIKANLPPDAVVQSSPSYTNYHWTVAPAPYYYPLIANFAERPMAVGCWGMPQMIPNIKDKFYHTLADITTVFETTNIDTILVLLDRYQIDYLYYGPRERMRWPGFEAVLQNYPQTFVREYDRDNVQIYRTVR